MVKPWEKPKLERKFDWRVLHLIVVSINSSYYCIQMVMPKETTPTCQFSYLNNERWIRCHVNVHGLSIKRWRWRWLINRKKQKTGRILLCLLLTPKRLGGLWTMKTILWTIVNLYPRKYCGRGVTLWTTLFLFRFASLHHFFARVGHNWEYV